MSNVIYTCRTCGKESTPEMRYLFATEYECIECWRGIVTRQQAQRVEGTHLQIKQHSERIIEQAPAVLDIMDKKLAQVVQRSWREFFFWKRWSPKGKDKK
jgi:DNA-directed RNA polymerase subunit RPC12/RpoP